MRRHDDGEAEEGCARCGPGAVEEGVSGEDFVMKVEEESGPWLYFLVFGGEGHEDQGYEDKRWGEEWGIAGESERYVGMVELGEEDAREDAHSDQGYSHVNNRDVGIEPLLLTSAHFDIPIPSPAPAADCGNHAECGRQIDHH